MSHYKKPFKCEVLTPAGQAMSVQAVSVVLPLADGELGVLADHAPLVAMVGAGTMKAALPGGQEETFFVSGGFAYMRGNELSVLAEDGASVNSLDPRKVNEELQQAQQMPADTPAQRRRRGEAVAIASAKLKAAQSKQ